MSSSRFSMVKWYLDCVTESGEVAIVYSAVARWRALEVSYCSYLCVDQTHNESRSTMRAAGINAEGQRLLVDSPQLHMSGEWTSLASAVKQTVFQDEAGSLVWDCWQPGSQVRLRIGDREWAGLGYAESLSLSIPPWQLPLTHLKWGRFVSEHDSLAWIDWQGPYSLRLVINNGERCALAEISDTAVVVDHAELQMSDSLSLREGQLGRTVIPGARALAKIFPKSMFNIEERKWRSRGTLTTPRGKSHGWVIHEAVDWNL